MDNLDDRISLAVKHFWRTRSRQGRKQGTATGRRDYGNRTVATGGKQLDGFAELASTLLEETGIPPSAIFRSGRENVTLPGYFRPSKQWDIVVVHNRTLLGAIEFKSLCGPSFGNNYNNRVEEALGSATDIWTAFREGAFQSTPRPSLGYLLLLEEAEASVRTVSVHEKHFPVFGEYRKASYAVRCEETVRRLLRERCYDSACFILSDRKSGRRGEYRQPAPDLTFERFAKLLCNQIVGAYRPL